MDTYNPDAIRMGFLHRIALNGIGQGWSVAPLHMARGVGSIASGKRIQPHIFKRWGDDPLPTPSAEELEVDKEVLNVLRAGMKAVPEAPGSTAIGTFSAPPVIVDGRSAAELRDKETAARLATVRATLKCRSYGKTGTADIGRGLGYNSGWFVGWKDPMVKGGRTIAFSCMTTHAIGSFRFGGTSCGRIIRDILTSIELAELIEVERKSKTEGGSPGVQPKKTGEDGPTPGALRNERDPGALTPR
jgi:cell division protein FtsI/penicillin-binding protein 2